REGIQPRRFQILALSARSSYLLEKRTLTVIEYLKRHKDADLADVAYTWRVGKRDFKHRRFVVCTDVEDALRCLEANDPERGFTDVLQRRKPYVVFMFPGGGTQYVNMGAGLYQQEVVYREQIDACVKLLKPLMGIDLRDLMYAEGGACEETTEQLKQPTNAL